MKFHMGKHTKRIFLTIYLVYRLTRIGICKMGMMVEMVAAQRFQPNDTLLDSIV